MLRPINLNTREKLAISSLLESDPTIDKEKSFSLRLTDTTGIDDTSQIFQFRPILKPRKSPTSQRKHIQPQSIGDPHNILNIDNSVHSTRYHNKSHTMYVPRIQPQSKNKLSHSQQRCYGESNSSPPPQTNHSPPASPRTFYLQNFDVKSYLEGHTQLDKHIKTKVKELMAKKNKIPHQQIPPISRLPFIDHRAIDQMSMPYYLKNRLSSLQSKLTPKKSNYSPTSLPKRKTGIITEKLKQIQKKNRKLDLNNFDISLD